MLERKRREQLREDFHKLALALSLVEHTRSRLPAKIFVLQTVSFIHHICSICLLENAHLEFK